MLGLLKIYFLFNLHFILIKCIVPGKNKEDLSVRILDKKLIEKKRQDTRDLCRMFNAETLIANPPTEALPFNKYDKRKQLLKLKEKKEELQKNKKYRIKRDVGVMHNVNPALNIEDEQRVEKIVDKIYDDLLEKGQNIAYRRRKIPETETKGSNLAANNTGRRFLFAPVNISGPTTTTVTVPMKQEEVSPNRVRFNHAIVPYFIDSRTYDTQLSEKIMKAFDYFEKTTCVRLQRLRERPTDQQSLENIIWLYITNPFGIRQCVHTNERAEIKGVQMVVFGYDCMSLGDIAHEIMHVLGFAHEHVRPDRDQHITILWDNIKPGYRKYFQIHDKPIVENFPYDYNSVLHYPPRAFSRNGQVTILTQPGNKIGQREGLSEMDVEKIGTLYSNECMLRNREYLLKTCPSVVKSKTPPTPINITQQEIEDYFEDRLWPFGVVSYKLRDKLEFSPEEIENINAVIRHIEKETCIEFRDLSETDTKDDDIPPAEYKFQNSGKLDNFVILASEENMTKRVHPDLTTSKEDSRSSLKKEIKDAGETGSMGGRRKDISGIKGKVINSEVNEKDANISFKGKDANIGAKNKDANIGAKVKDANIGTKGQDVNIGVKGKDTNIGVKEKYANIDAEGKNANILRQQSVNRRKRAVPPSQSRKHANSILVLARSPQPGCLCPRPGKPDRRHLLKINTDCFNSVNDLLHLFVHVLGLDHQHNMYDRDSYLHIVWKELTNDVKLEMKRKLAPAASVGFPYDYQSVMHYPWLQIKNGKTNIMYPIWNDGWAMGQWQGLSSTDVQKINLLYFKQCMKRKQQAEEVKQKTKEMNQMSEEMKIEPLGETQKLK